MSEIQLLLDREQGPGKQNLLHGFSQAPPLFQLTAFAAGSAPRTRCSTVSELTGEGRMRMKERKLRKLGEIRAQSI